MSFIDVDDSHAHASDPGMDADGDASNGDERDRPKRSRKKPAPIDAKGGESGQVPMSKQGLAMGRAVTAAMLRLSR